MNRTGYISEIPHAQQQYNRKYLANDVSEPETRKKKISVRNCGSTAGQCQSRRAQDNVPVPFIEMLPAANLLFSGGTVGSYTLFIAAFCRTFAIIE